MDIPFIFDLQEEKDIKSMKAKPF